MKKSVILLVTTLALATSIISTPSFARGFGGQGGQRPSSVDVNQGLLNLASVLNLTDEQIAEIEAIQEAQKEPAEANKEATEVARQSLRDMLKAGEYDEVEVATLADVIGDLVTQRVILESKAKFDISQVLTAEQREQLEDLLKTFESRRRYR
jgi:Spy/CpxP family protein refolding chaperone